MKSRGKRVDEGGTALGVVTRAAVDLQVEEGVSAGGGCASLGVGAALQVAAALIPGAAEVEASVQECVSCLLDAPIRRARSCRDDDVVVGEAVVVEAVQLQSGAPRSARGVARA